MKGPPTVNVTGRDGSRDPDPSDTDYHKAVETGGYTGTG